MGTDALEFGTDTDYKLDKLSDTDCKVDKLRCSYTHTGWHAHLLN